MFLVKFFTINIRAAIDINNNIKLVVGKDSSKVMEKFCQDNKTTSKSE